MAQDADAERSIPPEPRPAGFWIRSLAYALDVGGSVIAGVSLYHYALLAFGVPFYRSPSFIEFGYLLAAVAGILLLPLYSAAFLTSKLRATPGKLTIRAYVVASGGRHLGFWRAFGRETAKLLSLASLLIGFVMAAATREKTALHDLIAGTRVLRLPRRAETGTPAQVPEGRATAHGARREIGRLAYIFAGVGAIPVAGWPFGLTAMLWGLLSRKAGGKRVAMIAAICSFGMSGFYALVYFTTLQPALEKIDLVAKTQMTRLGLTRVGCHIDLFEAQRGRLPHDLGELYGLHYELDMLLDVTDPYGVSTGGEAGRLIYEPGAGPGGYTLFSVGRDGEAHTEDDIHPPIGQACPPFQPMRAAPDDGAGERDV